MTLGKTRSTKRKNGEGEQAASGGSGGFNINLASEDLK